MIRTSLPEDLPQLLTLWQEAFGDTKEETMFYFDHRHQAKNMLVLEQGSAILGMLSMLPVDLLNRGKVYPARYVFAVATKTLYRGQGVSTKLFDAAHEQMKEEGAAASLLVPATPSLFEFYRKRGYQTTFYQDMVTLRAEEIQKILPSGDAHPCTVENFYCLRERAFSNSALFARWDKEAVCFIIQNTEKSGGAVLHLRSVSGEGAAVCEQRDGGIRLTELALDQMAWPEALAIIHHALKAERYEVRLPQGMSGHGETIPFGMLHPFRDLPIDKGNPPWLALAKD